MVQKIGITKAITNLNEAHSKFNLRQSTDPLFFREWFEDLPEISESEKQFLNRLKNRYFYYAADGAITEGTINIIMLSPLIELLGMCDPPFKIRGEEAVKVELEDGNEDTRLEGFIDALIVHNQLWIVVIEAKRYGFNATLAVPQTLAYMMANPNSEVPVFGMITNGEDYIFVKLNRQLHQYSLSKKLTLSNPHDNELYEVLRVMKRIIGLIVQV